MDSEESKPDRRSVGRPLIGDHRMTNAEYLRRYRTKKGIYIDKRCPHCNKRLRKSSRLDICVACWLKTDDGREYLRLKQIESRSKKTHGQH